MLSPWSPFLNRRGRWKSVGVLSPGCSPPRSRARCRSWWGCTAWGGWPRVGACSHPPRSTRCTSRNRSRWDIWTGGRGSCSSCRSRRTRPRGGTWSAASCSRHCTNRRKYFKSWQSVCHGYWLKLEDFQLIEIFIAQTYSHRVPWWKKCNIGSNPRS